MIRNKIVTSDRRISYLEIVDTFCLKLASAKLRHLISRHGNSIPVVCYKNCSDWDWDWGLCGNLGSILSCRIMKKFFPFFKYYSGDLEYPVSMDHGLDFPLMSPRQAYKREPLYEGNYGERRIELAKFIFAQLQKEIKSRRILEESENETGPKEHLRWV